MIPLASVRLPGVREVRAPRATPSQPGKGTAITEIMNMTRFDIKMLITVAFRSGGRSRAGVNFDLHVFSIVYRTLMSASVNIQSPLYSSLTRGCIRVSARNSALRRRRRLLNYQTMKLFRCTGREEARVIRRQAESQFPDAVWVTRQCSRVATSRYISCCSSPVPTASNFHAP